MGLSITIYIQDKHKAIIEALKKNRLLSKCFNDFLDYGLEEYLKEKKEIQETIIATIQELREDKLNNLIREYARNGKLKEWITRLRQRYDKGEGVNLLAITEINKDFDLNVDKDILLKFFKTLEGDENGN